MINKKVKTPWYKYYDGVKEHLNYPNCTVYEYLEKTANKHLSNISYNYFGTKRTYHEFLNEINECAKSLRQLNIRKGDVVSICMPNTPEAIIAFYAINKVGAIANMIHPLSAESEIKYFVNISESKLIIAIDIAVNKINNIFEDTELKNIVIVSAGDSMPFYTKAGYSLTKGRKIKVKETKHQMKWSEFIKMGMFYDRKIKPMGKAKDTCAILYSGGTTGHPKGIELTNYNFNCLAVNGIEMCACLEEKYRILAIMPIFHGFGLGICIHTGQILGGTSILLPTFDANSFDKLLKKYRPNVIAGVPTLYEALLKNKNLEGVDLSFLKCVISGGDSLSISLKEKIDKFLKQHNVDTQVREGYGLTECVTGTCLTPLNYYRKGSIGLPYPDTYYKIVDPKTLEEKEYGQEGEICINAPTVMKGYLKDKEETRKVLKRHKDGLVWLHTGDVGYMDSDGFVFFKQRIKRMIISSGYNIYPQYIENIIDSHPDVLLSCVIGKPHPYKGQVAKAFIVLKPNVKEDRDTVNSIRKHCERNLAKYSWPYEYEIRKELPKTLVGKVAFKELEEDEEKKRTKKK